MRERSPGVWELRVFVGREPLTQKKIVVSRTARGGKREASTALAKLVTELDEPGFIVASMCVPATNSHPASLTRGQWQPPTQRCLSNT